MLVKSYHTHAIRHCILSPLMPKFRKRINKNLSKISLHLSEFVIIESPISTNRTGMYLLKVNNKGCLAHILLGPFLNTLSYMWHHIFSVSLYDKEKKSVGKEFIFPNNHHHLNSISLYYIHVLR